MIFSDIPKEHLFVFLRRVTFRAYRNTEKTVFSKHENRRKDKLFVEYRVFVKTFFYAVLEVYFSNLVFRETYFIHLRFVTAALNL